MNKDNEKNISKIIVIIIISIFIGILIGLFSSLMIMEAGDPDNLIWLGLLLIIMFVLLGAIGYCLNKLIN